MACSYKSFPTKIEDKFDKLKNKLKKHANKLQLDGEFHAKVYETEREYAGLVRGHSAIGVIGLQSYSGRLR